MQVGSLVMWAIKDADCYGDLGVVSDIADDYITIHWCDGLSIKHYSDIESLRALEVLCE